MTKRYRVSGSTVEELIEEARLQHESIRLEPSAALHSAFAAGDALNAAKELIAHGGWSAALRRTGIPSSTARLYMQLARERVRILAAGCTSIREARRLLAGTKPPPRSRGERKTANGKDGKDRYEEGYSDGYRAGRADGAGANGSVSLSRKDLRWLVTLAHPDRNDGALQATRVTQWLNGLMDDMKSQS